MCSNNGGNSDGWLGHVAHGPAGRAGTYTRTVTDTVGNRHNDSAKVEGEPRPSREDHAPPGLTGSGSVAGGDWREGF